jgi:SAM-dependent methyltransferase
MQSPTEALTPAIPFELESLSLAKRYQAWIGATIAPYLGKRILEIGSGLGNISEQLPVRERLILTEPDPSILARLGERVDTWQHAAGKVSAFRLDPARDSVEGLAAENLDTIVSFNVLEHIEDDRSAVAKLCSLLRESRGAGPRRLVSFVPAHSWAYGTLDQEFGHYRRYSHRSFRRLAEAVAPDAKFSGRYFNSVGLLGWILTGRILRKRKIGLGSIRAFEALCPIVRPLDQLLQTASPVPLFGQSLLTVLEFSGTG